MTSSAVLVPRHGGPEVLTVIEREVPTPGPGELVIEVAASGVNFIDVYKREGIYPTVPPFVLGEECAGTIVAIGDDVADVAIADIVATCSGHHGTHATHALIDAAKAVPVPAALDPALAAAAILQGMTAHYLVNSTFVLQAGQACVIHAAAGGVGQLLVQLAKAKGARVVATVGSEAKVAIAQNAGADVVLRSDEISDLAGAIREAAGGGVDVAYDGVGAATFEASLASLRPRGMLVLFGAASGHVPPFDLQRLNSAGSLFVTRPTLGHYVADRSELLWRSGEIFEAIADGSLRLEVGGRYSFEDAADAYRDLEGRHTTGKLLIVPAI